MTTVDTRPPSDIGVSSGQSSSPPETEEQAARRNQTSIESRLGYAKRRVTEAVAALAEAEDNAVVIIAAANAARGSQELSETELAEIGQIATKTIKRALAGARAAKLAIDKAKKEVKIEEGLLVVATEHVNVLRAAREASASQAVA
jgi:hypothetical protein